MVFPVGRVVAAARELAFSMEEEGYEGDDEHEDNTDWERLQSQLGMYGNGKREGNIPMIPAIVPPPSPPSRSALW